MTRTEFADQADRSDMSNPSGKVLKELSWIAELYEQRESGGFPRDPAGLHSLLSRACADVWTACRLLETPEPDPSDRSDQSDRSDKRGGLIPTHGGYRRLLGFQVAEVVYDGTAIFCERFIDKYSRTNDQMVQAARSGRQNIAEGSVASATSKKTELKLTNVAKASLEELLLDFEDFLRQGGLSQWDKDSPEAQAVRKRYRSADTSDKSDSSDKGDPYGIRTASPEAAANTLICLTNQAIYLLKKQIGYLEKDFVENGGFTEWPYRTRTEHRANSKTYYHRDGDPRKGVEK
jgi:restriction system protein